MNLESLRTHFRGEILTPESAGYNQARQIWNGMIDRRPAAILRCTGPDDVRAAVRFAVEQDIYPAIRAGGHNVAGIALVDNGLVIDVTQMKGIAIDAATRTALAQTGLTWGEFDGLTQSHGLATTGGLISTTGIAGLTLGGGVGWLMGRCGLVCDNTARVRNRNGRWGTDYGERSPARGSFLGVKGRGRKFWSRHVDNVQLVPDL